MWQNSKILMFYFHFTLFDEWFFLLDFNKHAEMLFTLSGHVDKYKCEVFYKQYI